MYINSVYANCACFGMLKLNVGLENKFMDIWATVTRMSDKHTYVRHMHELTTCNCAVKICSDVQYF